MLVGTLGPGRWGFEDPDRRGVCAAAARRDRDRLSRAASDGRV